MSTKTVNILVYLNTEDNMVHVKNHDGSDLKSNIKYIEDGKAEIKHEHIWDYYEEAMNRVLLKTGIDMDTDEIIQEVKGELEYNEGFEFI